MKPEWQKEHEYLFGRLTGPRHASVIALCRLLLLLGVMQRPETSVGQFVGKTRKFARKYKYD